jgi:iron complex transport system substrate-binding protein
VETRITAAKSLARPRVLFCDLATLTQPHLIVEWWIKEAGGKSVTDNGRKGQSFSFSQEQLLAWDPEVLILSDPSQVAQAYANPRYQGLSAVRNHRVYATPIGAHLWAHRTLEEPLTVLWAAKLIHPDLFQDVDMQSETAKFYQTFFHTTLKPDQIAEILSGIAPK